MANHFQQPRSSHCTQPVLLSDCLPKFIIISRTRSFLQGCIKFQATSK